MSNSVFSDFCQAWVARFPGSELPAAWEEDVRANLKKHKAKVTVLREEIEKEEMYVEYLDKLLLDIEQHRKSNDSLISPEGGEGFASPAVPQAASQEKMLNVENNRRSVELGVSKQKFLDDHLEDYRAGKDPVPVAGGCGGVERSSLFLDLEAVKAAQENGDENAFITVINVSSPNGTSKSKGAAAAGEQQQAGSGLTYTKAAPKKSSSSNGDSLLKKVPPRPPPKRASGSRDSLNSVSSPTTPSSPLISAADDFLTGAREGINTLSPKDPLMQAKLSSSDETIDENNDGDVNHDDDEDFDKRGRPDGRDNEDHHATAAGRKALATIDGNPSSSSSKVNNIKKLMANWENKPPISNRPIAASRIPALLEKEKVSRTKRKDSDSSSGRGRMGSPSGKSHDSSDSESSLSRGGGQGSESEGKKKLSGETRLDRLVRRPSGERHRDAPPIPPALPKAMRKPKAKPRTGLQHGGGGSREGSGEEPLYDTVANDEPAEDEYDNHLLYGTSSSTASKSDTLGSISADLGFDEPSPSLLKSGSAGSGTLSSSDSAGSPSLRRMHSLDEETNYVNIQYFLQRRDLPKQSSTTTMHTIPQSDDEVDSDGKASTGSGSREDAPTVAGKTGGASAAAPGSGEAERIVMYKCILTSIVESEAIYLEGLSVALQYMKAMKVTMSTPQPVIPKEEFDVIFYKIPELHDLHFTFHESLKKQVDRWNGVDSVGHTFKMLASRTKIYAAYLNNYQKALDALHRCTEAYPQFADLTRSIKLRTVKGQRQGQTLSLEDLLHKPVARVQKHCLCLQDLIKYTPESHSDYVTLTEALQQVQSFLNDYNDSKASELFPHQDRHQRHLVKNSFIVELDSGQRKLRHLFLFNDVLVCAKYKASSKSEKFTFLLKWYIPLSSALIVEEPSSEPKESSPANLVQLKTQAAALRDQIRRIEKDEDYKGRRGSSNSLGGGGGSAVITGHSKSSEKHRKKLAELEAQLVLASPSLVFQVTHKQTGKSYSFILSSEYERSQWVETLQVLQSSLPPPPAPSQQHPPNQPPSPPPQKPMSMEELQAWITSCRKFLKTNMGSFLMRSPRDEALLVGDLHFRLSRLQGLTRPADLFVVVEVDSYGHYFRKSKSRLVCGAMEPAWDEEFVVELEGSENLRILVYEQQAQGTSLRGRATLELSRSWLTGRMVEQRISMNDVVLTCSMKYVTFEDTIQRAPRPSGAGQGQLSLPIVGGHGGNCKLFGSPLESIAKKEKRTVPFIITSCVREVERRGISEVGIYRVSGSAADVARLKRAFENNPYEAEQLLKDCDIHSVAGILKLYLRDLPESLFTTPVYQAMFEAYQDPAGTADPERRKHAYLSLFSKIPQSPNQACVVFLIEHIVRVSQYEQQNKMSLHNLATVFGPTMLSTERISSEGGGKKASTATAKDNLLTTGTVDVMAQAGILHFFISRRARQEPIQIIERQV